MRDPIPMSSPDIDERDVEAVAEVVRSGRLALGPRVEAFERAIADHVGVRHAVAVSSGTAALHLALHGLGIGPGDEVLVPSFTFSASLNAILYVGATPVFVDVAPDTFNVDPDDVRRRIGPRTRAIVVVDVFGHPADWAPLVELAREHELLLIDDACEALGASYRGEPVGRQADVATFAFYPNKQITTGEGGMLVTDRDELAEVARSLRNQGRDSMGTWLTHERLGYNYRLDEMSAALGCSQMARLDEILARRARVADAYGARLAGCDALRLPQRRADCDVSWFVFVVLLARGVDRDEVAARLDEQGIPTRVYFSPLHRQPYVLDAGLAADVALPVTEDVGSRTLALPFHGGLSDAQVERVAGALVEACRAARRPAGATS